MRIGTTMMWLWTAAVAAPVCADAALPDPTRPYTFFHQVQVEHLPGAGVQWRLSGIWIRESEKSAILNGRLVREGDQFGPAVVLEIHPSEVVLSQDNQRLVVRLLAVSIKTPTGEVAAKTNQEAK